MTPQTTFATPYNPWKTNPTPKYREEVLGTYISEGIIRVNERVGAMRKATPKQDKVLAWLAANPNSSVEKISVAMGMNKYSCYKLLMKMTDASVVVRVRHLGFGGYYHEYCSVEVAK